MNLASAGLSITSLSSPSPALLATGTPLNRRAGELGAFLSLVTALLEKIPVMVPRQVGPLRSSHSDATGETPASKDKSEVKGKGSASALDKNSKDQKKDESPAPPLPARFLQEPGPFFAKLAAFEHTLPARGLASASEPASSAKSKNDLGLILHPDAALEPWAPAPPAVIPAPVNLAFTLRLTPHGSELINLPHALVGAAPPVMENVGSEPNSELVPKQPDPIPDPKSSGALPLPPALTSEPSAPAAPTAPVEKPSGPAATGQEVGVIPGPKRESAALAGAGYPEPGEHQPPEDAKTNNRLPVKSRSLPRPNPAVESGLSQPRESKPDPGSKPELPEVQLADRRVEGSTAAAVLAVPSDAAVAPHTRAAPPAAPESPAPKFAPEPPTKSGTTTPPARQISLRLSAEDSTRVNVDLTERAGKVLVAVRTSDHELAQSLQTDLGDLVGRLEIKGFKTEAWMPAVAHPAAVPSQFFNSDANLGQPPNSSSGNGSGQQRHGQNASNQRQKARWAAQLKQTMSGNHVMSVNQVRSEN